MSTLSYQVGTGGDRWGQVGYSPDAAPLVDVVAVVVALGVAM